MFGENMMTDLIDTSEQQLPLFPAETLVSYDNVEMGVLADGTPFLSQNGLARFCGLTNNGVISRITSEWEDETIDTQKPRMKFLKETLAKVGFTESKLFISVGYKGKEIYAYTGDVCMAILEYYAFESDEKIDIAQDRFRAMAKKSFADFIYESTGYIPENTELEKWKYLTDRISLNYDKTPDGFFSIFQEMVKPMHALIECGAIVNDKTIMDLSVGLAWANCWKKNKLEEQYGKRIKYEHNYPDYFPQSASNPQEPWAYPEEALPFFRKWFREKYLINQFPKYLKEKVKKGLLGDDTSKAIKTALTPKTIEKKDD